VVQDTLIKLHQPRHPGRLRVMLLLRSGGRRVLRWRRARQKARQQTRRLRSRQGPLQHIWNRDDLVGFDKVTAGSTV